MNEKKIVEILMKIDISIFERIKWIENIERKKIILKFTDQIQKPT